MANSGKRVPALTGLRALAGLYLLLFHYGQPLFAKAPTWAEGVRQTGYVATSFFLMLSGYVLTIAYARKLVDGQMSYRSFLIARVARLYPVYVFALLLFVPFAIVHRWGIASGSFGDTSVRYKIATAVGNVTMSQVLVPRLSGSWNVPGWCVSVEMWFYFAFPAIAVWLLRRRTRVILAALALSWSFAVTVAVAYTVLRPDGFAVDHTRTAFWFTLARFTPYARWSEFIFGVALGVVWLRAPDFLRSPRTGTPVLVIGLSLIVATALEGPRLPYLLLHNGVLLPVYALIVWGVMAGRGPIHRALSARPLTMIGDASYVLYLLQMPLIEWMVVGSSRDYHSLSGGFSAAAMTVIVGVSVAVHILVEKRAQTSLRVWMARRVDSLIPPLQGAASKQIHVPSATVMTTSG